MAKLVLEFDLPDEREEALRAQQGPDLVSVLWDLDEYLRSAIKYGLEGVDSATAQIIRDRLHELLDDLYINLEGET